jgi:hypothetical protein
MVTKKQTFKLKHTLTDQYVSNIDINELYKTTNTGAHKYPSAIGVIGEEGIHAKNTRNYCQYFREEVSEEDKLKMLVVSDILEPLTFYFDKPYLKCSKTHKYVCCTELKWECGGGSFLFLSYSKMCAIEFPDIKSEFLYYTKSLVYPGRGLPDYALQPDVLEHHINCEYMGGGHIVVNYKISENINMMAAYHTTNYNPKYSLTQEFMTDCNNEEILIVPENHDHKALKIPLEQSIKETGNAHYTLAKTLQVGNINLTDEECQEYANIAMEKRRKQG